MPNYDWKKIREMLEDVVDDEALQFNVESLYHLLRRFRPDLPFNFNKYIAECKECDGVEFIERQEVVHRIFKNELDEGKKLKFVSYLLHHFHKHQLNPKKLHKLENYLDENR